MNEKQNSLLDELQGKPFGNALASGMPEWSLEPPSVFINRRPLSVPLPNTHNVTTPVLIGDNQKADINWEELLTKFKNNEEDLSIIEALKTQSVLSPIQLKCVQEVLTIITKRLESATKKVPIIFSKEINEDFLKSTVISIRKNLNVFYGIATLPCLSEKNRHEISTIVKNTAETIQKNLERRLQGKEELLNFVQKNRINFF